MGDIPSYRSLLMRSLEHCRELGVNVLTGKVVERVDLQAKRVYLDGGWFDYDYLVIATGTLQRPLQIRGVELKGVLSAHIKTLKDC
jgi:NADPH-dependent 2,4-dienoyl-CoA reductase/sulfur reductase-like enzyme